MSKLFHSASLPLTRLRSPRKRCPGTYSKIVHRDIKFDGQARSGKDGIHVSIQRACRGSLKKGRRGT